MSVPSTGVNPHISLPLIIPSSPSSSSSQVPQASEEQPGRSAQYGKRGQVRREGGRERGREGGEKSKRAQSSFTIPTYHIFIPIISLALSLPPLQWEHHRCPLPGGILAETLLPWHLSSKVQGDSMDPHGLYGLQQWRTAR